MYGYSQPLDYRFSHDSIELAQRVAADLVPQPATALRVADLCAGCGVVGLEFARLITRPLSMDFVEIQDVYRAHFEKNVEWINSSRTAQGEKVLARWLEVNYATMRTADSSSAYDLVISNPPYFDRDQGKLPPSEFKARCRFFLDSDFAALLHTITHILKPGGVAYFLVRGLDDHGVSREEELNECLLPHGEWCWLSPVRGTGLVKFSRLPLDSNF